MKVVVPGSSTQNILFRTRTDEASVILSIREKGKDEFTNYNHLGTRANGYLTLGVEHEFKEGSQYQLLLFGANNKVIYRGLAFCTSQVPETYKIHPDLVFDNVPGATLPGGTPTSTTEPPEGSAAINDLLTRMGIVEGLVQHFKFIDGQGDFVMFAEGGTDRSLVQLNNIVVGQLPAFDYDLVMVKALRDNPDRTNPDHYGKIATLSTL